MISAIELTDEEIALIMRHRLRLRARRAPPAPPRPEGHLDDQQVKAVDRGRDEYARAMGRWPEEG